SGPNADGHLVTNTPPQNAVIVAWPALLEAILVASLAQPLPPAVIPQNAAALPSNADLFLFGYREAIDFYAEIPKGGLDLAVPQAPAARHPDCQSRIDAG